MSRTLLLIEAQLKRAIDESAEPPCPPRLAEAVRHAVLNGGSRVRPQLCLAIFNAAQSAPDRVAAARGADGRGGDAPPTPDLELATAAAIALELLHCGSLVHDDLPCFDDADVRRGAPTVHRVFDEATAVLVGDALIIRAFEIVARALPESDTRGPRVLSAITRSVGMPFGIVAGQAWEFEASVDLAAYHRAKTGALFVAACRAGAIAAGGDPEHWSRFGAKLGEAYQVADDLKDHLCDAAEIGKPAGQDTRHDRPSAVIDLGLEGAQRRLLGHLGDAMRIAGSGPGTDPLRRLVIKLGAKLLPPEAVADLQTNARELAAQRATPSAANASSANAARV
ncbi:MAG: polyprenyl synthetase family protein [Pseudomonadota bacterium]